MRKCKRCHAPDELNGAGLCKHCTAFIKNDMKQSKARLDAIYDCFPDGMESLDETEKAALLAETEELFQKLDSYHRIGFPVGSYVMPVRKILHFLDSSGALEKRLLARQRKLTAVGAACCAALAVAFAVTMAALLNNPLTGKNPGEALSVSAKGVEAGNGMIDAGAPVEAMKGAGEGETFMDDVGGAPEEGGAPIDDMRAAGEGEAPMDGMDAVGEDGPLTGGVGTNEQEQAPVDEAEVSGEDEASENGATASQPEEVSTAVTPRKTTAVGSGGAVAVRIG